MSKSAIKHLTSANEILSALGLTIGNPASWMNNEQARNQFKNADLLACLIIDSAANALICENVDTLDANMYDDMQQAVEGYIQANLDSWSQAKWTQCASLCDVAALLAKLLDAVAKQRAYNARQKAHAEALEMNKSHYFEEKYPATMQYNEFTEQEVNEAREADLLHTWQTSDINTARACQAAADKGLFLYAVYRHEWKECGGYVDAHADIKMLPRDGKVQLHIRTSAASWWQHDSTHIDAASAYACACAIFETTDFVKLVPGHA